MSVRFPDPPQRSVVPDSGSTKLKFGFRRAGLGSLQGSLDRVRELLSRAASPVMEKNRSWLFARHVVVNGHDIDVGLPQRLEDLLQLVLQHHEVSIYDGVFIRSGERSP